MAPKGGILIFQFFRLFQEFNSYVQKKGGAMLIGSKEFLQEWRTIKKEQTPRAALEFLLASLAMPEDLSGQLEENQALVAKFSPDLAPHDRFWAELTKQVRLAMKGRDFQEKTSLNRQLHQLRYVISSQQAQYVRQYYRKHGMSDQDALIAYLRANHLRPSLWDHARLHNKRQINAGDFHFPDQQESYNIKVLLQFRTEFIIDSQGNFLNEVDAEKVTANGIINGASFNYGNNNKSHFRLDVYPVSPHDPAFRNQATKGYRSPNRTGRIRLGRFWQERQTADFEKSFYNKKGGYAKEGQALISLVKQRKKVFKRALRDRK